MPSAEMRARLAAQQADLAKALTGAASPPTGFDVACVEAAAEALARKRCCSAANAWPILARVLSDRFQACFAGYAAVTSLPDDGGPLADGRAFARFLEAAGTLPEEARLELTAVDLHYTSTKRGMLPRHGFALRAALLRRPRGLVLGIRLPWFGVRWLSIALGRTS